MYPIVILTLVVTYCVYKIVTTIAANRRHAKRAAELGCKIPMRRPHKWPFGIDLVKRVLDADRDQQVPQMFVDVYDEQGERNTWVQQTLGSDLLVTAEPKNIQALLATQFHDFEIGELRRANFFPMLGNGIFTSDGKAWEHSRALLRPNFARDQVIDADAEEPHIQDMMLHLSTDASGWTDVVNMGSIFFRMTLDSATEFLFGESVGSQIAALPDNHPARTAVDKKGDLDWTAFGPAFDSATMSLGVRGRLNELYWLYNPAHFRKNCREVNRFADYYVNRALHPPQDKGKDLEKGSKKEKYVFLDELVKSTRDPIELRSQLLNILLAGRDTTAGLLGFTFYLLARHSDVFDKLRQRILEDFGTYQNPHNLDFASIKACTYLQHVLSETLRMYATVPLNSRRAVRDTTIPVGGGPDGKSPIYVRKGDEVNYIVHVMHQRKDLWGPDAREFNPDRWVNRKAGWEFLPFNGGPRVCLGQQHALSLASYNTIRLLQRFDKIEDADPSPRVKHQYSVTTAPAQCLVRFHEAE